MDHIENDDELHPLQVTVLAVAYAVLLLLWKKKQRICREPSHERLEIREKYLPRLIDGNNTTGINMIRMNKSTFFNLWSILR